jgi:adenylosuccinate lyase
MLTAISPVDGRYADKTKSLIPFFSEYALIRYRLLVEIAYFKALCEIPLPGLAAIDPGKLARLDQLMDDFTPGEAEKIKDIERTTNHDVKAVEYYLKSFFSEIGLAEYQEYVHFGLTSQDVNNTATPMMIKAAVEEVYRPALLRVRYQLYAFYEEWRQVPMLARTHGQPASPTRLGKEFMVFVERLDEQIRQLVAIPWKGKFGGATGNFNAHHVAFPAVDWIEFSDQLLSRKLGLERSRFTTQIEHYDNLAALFHVLSRINTILIDLCRDLWTYISMDYFRQKTVKGEVGSSAMPHKVNPIDFENAEGNLGYANAIFVHLAEKLPISRLQRDLTDSTVIRNAGVPFAHTLIALQSIEKGFGKLLLNRSKMEQDLEANWMVVAEAIQTILRREAFPQPYEVLKELTRGRESISREQIHEFIDNLNVSPAVRKELKQITPQNYTGL